VYDVALDIHADLQMEQHHPNIPMVPSIVRFPLLMPMDGATMRDRYGKLRWKAIEFLKGKNVIKKIDILQGGHRWETRVELQVDSQLFQKMFNALEAEYLYRNPPEEAAPGGRHENIPMKDDKSAPTDFEKVTIPWLINNLTLRVCIYFLGLLFIVFMAGIRAGHISLVWEITGPPHEVNKLRQDVGDKNQKIKNLEDDLNKANKTIGEMTHKIADLEKSLKEIKPNLIQSQKIQPKDTKKNNDIESSMILSGNEVEAGASIPILAGKILITMYINDENSGCPLSSLAIAHIEYPDRKGDNLCLMINKRKSFFYDGQEYWISLNNMYNIQVPYQRHRQQWEKSQVVGQELPDFKVDYRQITKFKISIFKAN
jgi:hypothetical protein